MDRKDREKLGENQQDFLMHAVAGTWVRSQKKANSWSNQDREGHEATLINNSHVPGPWWGPGQSSKRCEGAKLSSMMLILLVEKINSILHDTEKLY